MHGLLFNIQYGHYDSPPASRVNHTPRQLPENWGFNHSQTTIAKCEGVPYCMKIKSLILSQAITICQTSSFSIPFGIHGIMKDEGTHNPIRSHSTPYRYLGSILHFLLVALGSSPTQ